jgi:4-alpha-glucanotransferase
MNGRGSGILFHLTSLPSPFGIGDMGPWAYKFADFLSETGQRFWQFLPLNPTDPINGNSPYHSISAFAGNPLLISPEILVQEGLLVQDDLAHPPGFSDKRVDYGAAAAYKDRLFHRAYERFRARGEGQEYRAFCLENAHWLDDFALFVALKSRFNGKAWIEWPEGLRERQEGALRSAGNGLGEILERERFLQYLFSRQWTALKGYCNGKGIQLIGDIPIYVVHDSVEAWIHPECFKLDHDRRPAAVAGVPPDYFSETGQLWGNPVYRWDVLKETGYAWWIRRMAHNLRLFDYARLDHFRGFVAYWEVPAGEENAIKGKWIEAPAMDFFTRLTEHFPSLPIIAEDLGVITPDVEEIMRHFHFPGMKILLFAFGHDLPTNPYAPHNHVKHCVVYTGTHDNNTSRGWFEEEATPEVRRRLSLYVGGEVREDNVHRALIRLAMMSVANRVIFPMQDILGLGEGARMNRPARRDGNWRWRLLPEQIGPALARDLLEMTEIYGRGES